MGLFDGKVTIVTGAGRGIGAAEAALLASEGVSVAVNNVDGVATGEGADQTPGQQVVDTITAAGGVAGANYFDVSSWSGAEALVSQAVDGFGRLDVLVNNAGILREAMSFSMSEAESTTSSGCVSRGISAQPTLQGPTGERSSRRVRTMTPRSSLPHRRAVATAMLPMPATPQRRRALHQ